MLSSRGEYCNLLSRLIPERLSTTSRYTNPRLPLPCFTLTRMFVSISDIISTYFKPLSNDELE